MTHPGPPPPEAESASIGAAPDFLHLGWATPSFQLKVPTIEPGGYAIHGFLYSLNFFDAGTFLDRGSVPFKVA